MGIRWNERTSGWFCAASEYTGYNKKLAAILLKHIPERTTLCDVGCGSGLIDFELAPYFDQITCVDISSIAIDWIEKRCRQQGIRNINPVCMDAKELTGEWDTVLSLFYGGPEGFVNYFPHARKQVVLVTYMESKGKFGPKAHKIVKQFDTAGIMAWLDESGIRYTLEEYTLEHGQPLRDLEDAKAFVRAYTLPMCEDELLAYLDKHLKETGEEEFPYYLPKQKHFGLFVIRRDENKHLF